jgi:5-methylcytosine-specific restriction endonuclease McrA
MTERPPSVCLTPGCPEFAAEGRRCQTHRAKVPGRPDESLRAARRRSDAKRDPKERGFYWSTVWRRLRLLVLAREPVCRACGRDGATEVDHIKPIRDGGQRLSFDNLQALCGPCHSRKTRRENR